MSELSNRQVFLLSFAFCLTVGLCDSLFGTTIAYCYILAVLVIGVVIIYWVTSTKKL